MTPAFFALLMRDSAKLLRPAPVVAVLETTQQHFLQHPSANIISALSDVSALFQPTSQDRMDSVKPASPNPCAAKLVFYAARIASTPTAVLTALSDEALARANLIEREGTSGWNVDGDRESLHTGGAPVEKASKPRIEEL